MKNIIIISKFVIIASLALSTVCSFAHTPTEQKCSVSKSELTSLMNLLSDFQVGIAYHKVKRLLNECITAERPKPITIAGKYTHAGGHKYNGDELPAKYSKIVITLENGRKLYSSALGSGRKSTYNCNSNYTLCTAIKGFDCKQTGSLSYDTYSLEGNTLVYTNACGSYHYYNKVTD